MHGGKRCGQCSLRLLALPIFAAALTVGRAWSVSAQSAPVEEGAAQATPVPAWVVPVALPLRAVAPAGGVENLLDDTQVRVHGERVQHVYRRAVRPISPAGLSSASHVRMRLDPTYQDYTWHYINLRRGDAVLDALANADVRRADTDGRDSSAVVHGRTEITAFLRDVRVGDVVEYAYSVEGDQPALGGMFSDGFEMARFAPVGVIQLRLLWPRQRQLYLRAHGTELEPRRAQVGDEDELVWRVENSPAVEEEPSTPPWVDTVPWIQLSEFRDWAAVVRWALPMYDPRAAEQTPELGRQLDAFRAGASQQLAAERAVRFVQDEIRYLGFEFGEGSLRPRPPKLVLERRFGDCKDKTLLLVHFLHALGIDAVPALVHSSNGDAVSRRWPAPLAFDHVIVRVRLAGRTIWVDPTQSGQRGSLLERGAPPYVVALPIAAGVTDLEQIPLQPLVEPDMVVHEEFKVESGKSKSRLEVTTRFRGQRASEQRHLNATRTLEEQQKQCLKFYQKRYKKVALTKPLTVEDDEARDELTMREWYEIEDMWNASVEVDAWAVSQLLVLPADQPARKTPLVLPFPAYVRHEIVLTVPSEFDDGDNELRIDRREFSASYAKRLTGNRFDLTYEYRALSPRVDPSDIAQYQKDAERLQNHLGYVIPATGNWSSPQEESPLPALILLGMLFVGIGGRTMWVKLADWRARGRRRRFEAAKRVTAGESAATALAVASLDAITAHMLGLRCGCAERSKLRAEQPPSVARYMGNEVWHQAARCPGCNTRLVRYFTVQ